ncbi:hypothetical protein [Micromonospora sp. NBC_01813]|uniref:hypothetical protein n=1 Tax=Micromonospora sp. NBC_01813 TaxID=2975988 RepID=UPI002DDC28F8|nr:hypothetical protein [Micromonospora sp. NBC_01813]WSA09235.1 hypothetical protein OG958_34695 [Micromonospora sp. NBC_01813]
MTDTPAEKRDPADGQALQVAAETIDVLRTVALAMETAVTHAEEQLHGGRHPDAGLATDRYQAALHEAWEAYGEVLDAVAAGRPQLPGGRPVAVASILYGLRTARHHAAHAAAQLPGLRDRLASAADRLHRSDRPPAQAVADRLTAALGRLRDVETSLALGTGAVDRYLDALDTGADPPAARTARLAAVQPVARPAGGDAAAIGTRTAAAVVAANRRQLRFRTRWQLVRRSLRESIRREVGL